MNTERWVVDAEFENRDNEQYLEDLKLKVYPKRAKLFGIYNMNKGEYTYLLDSTIHDVINYIFENSSCNNIYVYAYFNTAELSCHLGNFFSEFHKMGIEIKKIIPKGKVNFVVLQKRGGRHKKVLYFLDVMALLGIQQSLESTCKSFGVQNPKEYLYQLGFEHDENIVNNLTLEQLIEYNKRDCMATAELINKFMLYIKELVKKYFGIDISPENSWTLGSIISKIIRKIEKKYNENVISFYANFLRRYREGKFYGTDEDRLAKKVIELGLQAYRGGGLIIYYDKPNKYFDNVYIYDVVSLYPLSAYLMAQKIPLNVFEIQPLAMQDVEEKINDPQYEGFVLARLKLKEGKRCYVAYRDVDITDIEPEKAQRSYYIKEVPAQYYSFFELRIIKMLGDYEIKYGNMDNDIQVGYYWKGSQYKTLLTYFDTLLELKGTIKESDNPALYNMVKLLLNASYGKLVEKEKELYDEDFEKYLPPLFAPLLGALITSYSRGIMYLLNGHYNGFHYATDSLFVTRRIDVNEATKLVGDVLKSQGLVFPRCYKVLLKEEMVNASGIVLRGKAYYFVSGNGLKIKEAHHAIHVGGKDLKVFWEIVGQHPYTIIRYKRETWLSYRYVYDRVKNKKNFKNKTYLYNYIFLECEKEYIYFPAQNNYLTSTFEHFEDLKHAKISLRKVMNRAQRNRKKMTKILEECKDKATIEQRLQDELSLNWLANRHKLHYIELF